MDDSTAQQVEIKGKIGETIQFKRKRKWIMGKIIIVREMVCIVEITEEDAAYLGYETTKSVIRHGNYKVIQ